MSPGCRDRRRRLPDHASITSLSRAELTTSRINEQFSHQVVGSSREEGPHDPMRVLRIATISLKFAAKSGIRRSLRSPRFSYPLVRSRSSRAIIATRGKTRRNVRILLPVAFPCTLSFPRIHPQFIAARGTSFLSLSLSLSLFLSLRIYFGNYCRMYLARCTRQLDYA